jgi:anthranilate phosphoribosyltransferase
LLGVGRGDMRETLAKALSKLGTTRAIVVHSRDGLGEITISGATDVSEVRGPHVASGEIWPEDFRLPRSNLELLKVQNPQQSADLILRVLDGQTGPARNIVIANAAATLWVSGICDDLLTGVERCQMAVDQGHARQVLDDLKKLTND